MVSLVDITKTSPKNWRYVSEGGATIVFSYNGPKDEQFDGMVLRLRKAIYPDTIQVRPLEEAEQHKSIRQRFTHYLRGMIRRASQDSHTVEEELDDPMIEYQHKCMQRLISADHLPKMESAGVNKKWLKALEKEHDHVRPAERRNKDGIDKDRRKAVLATDLIGDHGLSVEIKPKWAFLPKPDNLSNDTRAVKTTTCRFCMHAHLKAEEGSTVAQGYCPLDLFSDDEERMTTALHNLWDAWVKTEGAANNLKIFVDGHLMRPSEDLSTLSKVLEQPSNELSSLSDPFAHLVVSHLRSVSVLSTLNRLQRTLDSLDIEGLSDLWRKAEVHAQSSTPSSPTEPANQNEEYPRSPIGVSSPHMPTPEPNIEDWSALIDEYLNSRPDATQPKIEDLRYYLLAYLLSATFKDCSIILRPESKGAVTVIDLDPKSLSRLKKWEKLDTEIVTAYAKVPKNERRRCTDAGTTTATS